MRKFCLLTICVLMAAGCTTTQKGTSIGAASGALLGGVIGHQSGNRDKGALIGAAVGGAGGYAVGEKMKAKFCPVGGEHYDESVNYCPKHGVELQYKQ